VEYINKRIFTENYDMVKVHKNTRRYYTFFQKEKQIIWESVEKSIERFFTLSRFFLLFIINLGKTDKKEELGKP
jgi:hypothetical protein